MLLTRQLLYRVGNSYCYFGQLLAKYNDYYYYTALSAYIPPPLSLLSMPRPSHWYIIMPRPSHWYIIMPRPSHWYIIMPRSSHWYIFNTEWSLDHTVMQYLFVTEQEICSSFTGFVDCCDYRAEASDQICT